MTRPATSSLEPAASRYADERRHSQTKLRGLAEAALAANWTLLDGVSR
jgi:hypothetical protein